MANHANADLVLPDVRLLALERRGPVLYVTLNRPESRNAMNQTMLAEVNDLFKALHQTLAIRAVVLRGAGGHFCAGGDLKEMLKGGLQPVAEGEPSPVVAYSRAFGSMLRSVEQAPQVVIAICDGSVMGGGFGLACVSDIAMAHEKARFALPETTRGLPPVQIAPFVVRRIGLTQARKLCLTGARFDGTEAARLGVVHEVFADEPALQALLNKTLRQVCECAPAANAMTKAIIQAVEKMDMDDILTMAAHKFDEAVRGREAPEGIQAFLQKRAPSWAKDIDSVLESKA